MSATIGTEPPDYLGNHLCHLLNTVTYTKRSSQNKFHLAKEAGCKSSCSLLYLTLLSVYICILYIVSYSAYLLTIRCLDITYHGVILITYSIVEVSNLDKRYIDMLALFLVYWESLFHRQKETTEPDNSRIIISHTRYLENHVLAVAFALSFRSQARDDELLISCSNDNTDVPYESSSKSETLDGQSPQTSHENQEQITAIHSSNNGHNEGIQLEYIQDQSQNETLNGKQHIISEENEDNHNVDIDWLNVGKRLSMKILNNQEVQTMIADTSIKLKNATIPEESGDDSVAIIKTPDNTVKSTIVQPSIESLAVKTKNIDTKSSKPKHSLWTSPSAAAITNDHLFSEHEENIDSIHYDSDYIDQKEPLSTITESRSQKLNIRGTAVPKVSEASSAGTSTFEITVYERNTSGGSPVEQNDEKCSHHSVPTVASCFDTTSIVSAATKSFVSSTKSSKDNESKLRARMRNSFANRRRNSSGVTEVEVTYSTDVVNPSIGTASREFASVARLDRRRPTINYLPGGKIIVPIESNSRRTQSSFQMATIISSRRIIVNKVPSGPYSYSNCTELKVALDRFYLRDGAFATMTIRLLDENPVLLRSSAYPIGACVATTFGLGVLIGWRVEDDCHIVRSLWNKRGHGSAMAFLNRKALFGVVKGCVGFDVITPFGKGMIIGFKNGGASSNLDGSFILKLEEAKGGHIINIKSQDINECPAAKFIPVCSQVEEAALYQLRLHAYNNNSINQEDLAQSTLKFWSKNMELLIDSFVKAVGEVSGIDKDIQNFLSSIISFVENVDTKLAVEGHEEADLNASINSPFETSTISHTNETDKDGLWLFNDALGGIFDHIEVDDSVEVSISFKSPKMTSKDLSYKKALSIINVLLRTIAIATPEAKDKPDLQMSLYIFREVLYFVKTALKIKQKNVNKLTDLKREQTMEELIDIFLPIHHRINRIWNGIMKKIEKHGEVAKRKLRSFLGNIFHDDGYELFEYIEKEDWDGFGSFVENAAIRSKMLDVRSCQNIRRSAIFLLQSLAPRSTGTESKKKVAWFAFMFKWLAAPKISFLKFLTRDDVQIVAERILVGVFGKECNSSFSRTINIYAFNFQTLRQLRLLTTVEISGSLWVKIFEATYEELGSLVFRMKSGTARDIFTSLINLFGLGISNFNKVLRSQKLSWTDFLFEPEATSIVNEIDTKIFAAFDNLCKDLKVTIDALPYYERIDEDLLNLMNDVELDKVFEEISEMLVDNSADKLKFNNYLKEKSERMINKLLEYLPQMSIPVERRDINEQWVITCRSGDGKDLKLSQVQISRENLVCHIMGSDNLLGPLSDAAVEKRAAGFEQENIEVVKTSVLDSVKELLVNAQRYGCWEAGYGGVGETHKDSEVAAMFEGLFLSKVLATAIDLWSDLEIDDDELMEIAIQDVSYQIKLQKEREEGIFVDKKSPVGIFQSQHSSSRKRRFNPRSDLFFMLNLTGISCCLDEFLFRIEPKLQYSQFDPTFQGTGFVMVNDVSLSLKIELRRKKAVINDMLIAVLQLEAFDISLNEVKLEFKETGFDWLLNLLTTNFELYITEIIEDNMKAQLLEQLQNMLSIINSFFEANSDLVLKVLDLTIDDLDDCCSGDNNEDL